MPQKKDWTRNSKIHKVKYFRSLGELYKDVDHVKEPVCALQDRNRSATQAGEPETMTDYLATEKTSQKG